MGQIYLIVAALCLFLTAGAAFIKPPAKGGQRL